jgi:aromatic amino acid aminotransferase I / 2-aminoadipate transaminase
MDHEKLPEAIDLSHHLSRLSKARITSPLKGLQKYWGKEGLISLAGGLPSPAYFPFGSLSGEGLVSDSFPLSSSGDSSSLSWFWKLFGIGAKEHTTTLTVNKFPARPSDLNLAQTLQYG